MCEKDLFNTFENYLVTMDDLKRYDYPARDPEHPDLCLAVDAHGRRRNLKSTFTGIYTCVRCNKNYNVGDDGVPLVSDTCRYHSEGFSVPNNTWYCCRKQNRNALGCRSNEFHVHKGENELSNYKNFRETEPRPLNDQHGVYALDCEMCYTVYGYELIRVTVVNYKGDVVYDKLVKPNNRVLDYNTMYTGLKYSDLKNVSVTLVDVQQDLLSMFSDKTILVGHGLDSDMKVLRLFHKRFIDTVVLYPHRHRQKRNPLKWIAKRYLGVNIQTGIHDSAEDARIALKLAWLKVGFRPSML